MIVLYIIIIIILVIIVIFLSLALYRRKKVTLNDYDNKLILFVIDMYLSYGESLDIFPNNDAKKNLINRIKILENKILNSEKNNEKIKSNHFKIIKKDVN